MRLERRYTETAPAYVRLSSVIVVFVITTSCFLLLFVDQPTNTDQHPSALWNSFQTALRTQAFKVQLSFLTIKDHQGCFIFNRRWLKVYIDFTFKKYKEINKSSLAQRDKGDWGWVWPRSLIHYTLVFTDDIYVAGTEHQPTPFWILDHLLCKFRANLVSSLWLLLRQIGPRELNTGFEPDLVSIWQYLIWDLLTGNGAENVS